MSIADDMLKGAQAVSTYTGFELREVYRCFETKALPLFKVGRLICGRKSELDRRLSGQG